MKPGERIKTLFKKRFEEIDERGNLAKYGIDVLRNELLQARISESRTIIEEIFGSKDVADKIGLQEKLIRLITLPWGRGGDRAIFLEAMINYEMILSYWHGMYNMNKVIEAMGIETMNEAIRKLEMSQNMITQQSGQAQMLLQQQGVSAETYGRSPMKFFMPRGQVRQLLEDFGEREILPFGWIVYDIGWLSMDVAPQYAAIVQGAVQPGTQQSIQPFYKSEYGEKKQ